MTNEEAKTFLDNLKVCIEEHPIVADWLVEIADRKTEPTHDLRTETHECVKDTHDKTEPQYSEDDMYWLSLAEDVANGKMSDAGANQAWLEYINHKDEPTISKMEQVEDEPQDECAKEYEELGLRKLKELRKETQTETQNSNLTFKTLEYCDICDHKGCKECISNALDEYCVPSHYHKVEDEPQTYVINPQEPTNNDKCFKCDDFFTCGGQCNKIEDEPQTDCAWK